GGQSVRPVPGRTRTGNAALSPLRSGTRAAQEASVGKYGLYDHRLAIARNKSPKRATELLKQLWAGN
ncbi:MAG: hypothetical protein P8M53_09855, partial [Pirellulales bacterium]|nr:hypothetical protein [Pirellulales bacterium]